MNGQFITNKELVLSDIIKSILPKCDNAYFFVDKMKGINTSSLEKDIDFLVYHIYGLTYDEILIIDSETPITKEEYEKFN